MNDLFLSNLRKPPPPEFAERIFTRYKELSGEGQRHRVHGIRHAKVANRLVVGFSVLSLLFVVLMLAVPGTRAAILREIRKIGGIPFLETESSPAWDDAVERYPSIKQVDLSEAQDLLPFSLNIPDWAPDGFRFIEDEVDVNTEANNAVFTWRNNAGEIIRLSATRYSGGDPSQVVGQMAIEEVYVNNQPAALVRGTWTESRESFDPNSGLIVLYWKRGDITYMLFSTERIVEKSELIRMAESLH